MIKTIFVSLIVPRFAILESRSREETGARGDSAAHNVAIKLPQSVRGSRRNFQHGFFSNRSRSSRVPLASYDSSFANCEKSLSRFCRNGIATLIAGKGNRKPATTRKPFDSLVKRGSGSRRSVYIIKAVFVPVSG